MHRPSTRRRKVQRLANRSRDSRIRAWPTNCRSSAYSSPAPAVQPVRVDGRARRAADEIVQAAFVLARTRRRPCRRRADDRTPRRRGRSRSTSIAYLVLIVSPSESVPLPLMAGPAEIAFEAEHEPVELRCCTPIWAPPRKPPLLKVSFAAGERIAPRRIGEAAAEMAADIKAAPVVDRRRIGDRRDGAAAARGGRSAA